MCGRFIASTPSDELARYLGAREPTAESSLRPSFNVAPTQLIHAAHESTGERRLDVFRWGLVPSWAKDSRTGSPLINARSETAHSKPSFRNAFSKRRCIIAADGFYEWQRHRGTKHKQPMLIRHRDRIPFAFAGLWETWQGSGVVEGAHQDEERLRTCAILTCAANAKMALVHDRMPVILPSEAWDFWLDPHNTDRAALRALMLPSPEETLSIHPVSVEVNNARNNGPHLLEPIQT